MHSSLRTVGCISLTFACSIFPLSVSAQGEGFGQESPHQPACWPNQRLFDEALKAGFQVQGEGLSEMPGTSGAYIYFMLNEKAKMWGIIGSGKIDGNPRQCNLGVATNWQPLMAESVVIVYDAEPLAKSLRLCRPLTELLMRMKASLLEVPLGRASRGPLFDTLLTVSGNGSWSLLQIDKRSPGIETACFSNWGTGFQPGKSFHLPPPTVSMVPPDSD